MDISKLTKLYYTIGEVADFFDVSTSLLRYWETQFKSIKPIKDRSGNRRYRVQDIESIQKIYQLVKVQGFTLEGAKKHLSVKREAIADVSALDSVIENLTEVSERLKKLERAAD